MTKEELEVLLASDNRWAGYSTLVLAVGILGEYVVLPFFDKESGKQRLYAGIKILFALMVVIGVLGEYRFSSRIADTAGQIQRASDAEVIHAETSASEAQLQAKSASDGATGAFKQAKDAVAEAGKANERASVNEREAARLNKIAADERLEILALEEHQLPRTVSIQQRQSLAKHAKGMNLGVVVAVESDLFAGIEARAYAGQIASALGNAGIGTLLPADESSNPMLSGILVCASKTAADKVKNASIRLRDLLIATGFQRVNEPALSNLLNTQQKPVPCIVENNSPAFIWLIVGSK